MQDLHILSGTARCCAQSSWWYFTNCSCNILTCFCKAASWWWRIVSWWHKLKTMVKKSETGHIRKRRWDDRDRFFLWCMFWIVMWVDYWRIMTHLSDVSCIFCIIIHNMLHLGRQKMMFVHTGQHSVDSPWWWGGSRRSSRNRRRSSVVVVVAVAATGDHIAVPS